MCPSVQTDTVGATQPRGNDLGKTADLSVFGRLWAEVGRKLSTILPYEKAVTTDLVADRSFYSEKNSI